MGTPAFYSGFSFGIKSERLCLFTGKGGISAIFRFHYGKKEWGIFFEQCKCYNRKREKF